MDKITKAIRHITNIRDKNYVALDNFKKEIEKNINLKESFLALIDSSLL